MDLYVSECDSNSNIFKIKQDIPGFPVPLPPGTEGKHQKWDNNFHANRAEALDNYVNALEKARPQIFLTKYTAPAFVKVIFEVVSLSLCQVYIPNAIW